MSETSGGGVKKGKIKPNKPAKSGLRGWNASTDGSSLSRTLSYGSTDEAGNAARKVLATFQKIGQPVDLRLDGVNITIRVGANAGQVDDQMKKLTKRLAPKDPAKKAAFAAAKEAKGAKPTTKKA